MEGVIIGINLGCYNMSIVEGADVNGFQTHMLENAKSQKLTRAIIEYKENIRHVGYNISPPGRRSRNVFTSPKSILGLNKDACIKEVEYYPKIQVVGIEEHRDVDIQEFRLNYLGNDKFVNSVQIYISFLKFLKEMIKNNVNEVNGCVISYPPYYTEKQLFCLRELLREIEMSERIRLIPEYIGSGLCYGYENNDRLKLNKSNEIVAIVDMGYICTSCSIFKYESNKMKFYSNKNEKLGGRDIDMRLMEYIYKKMKEECKDVKDYREDYSLYKKIEKSVINCKEKLSADGADEIILNVESFYEDEDFETTLKVEDLNQILKGSGYDQKLKKLVYETITESGLNEEDKKSLEIVIVGGSMRIPLFKNALIELLKEINGKDRLIKSMNKDEKNAYGCCYYGGIKNGKWKYIIENFKEKEWFEKDDKIMRIIEESLEKEKEMEEEDNKTKRNSSYRNELEGIKFQLKSKVNVIEEEDKKIYSDCMKEIDDILKHKDNTFEDYYQKFSVKYDEKIIYKYLSTYTSLHTEDISNVNIDALYKKIIELYEGNKIEIERVEKLKEEYCKNPALDNQQIINMKYLCDAYAIANSGFDENYHIKELNKLKEQYEYAINSISKKVEIRCDIFTNFKEWLYNYINRKVIMLNEDVELKESEIKKRIKYLNQSEKLYVDINPLMYNIIQNILNRKDIETYCPYYYPQYEIAQYYSQHLKRIINDSKDSNELNRGYKLLNDMIKDDVDFYKKKYTAIVNELDILIEGKDITTKNLSFSQLYRTCLYKHGLKYKKMEIDNINTVSFDVLKSRTCEFEKYLNIIKERKKIKDDRDDFVNLLNNVKGTYSNIKNSIEADINQLKNIKEGDLNEYYNEEKEKCEKKYENEIINFRLYKRLNDMCTILSGLGEYGRKYDNKYEEYKNEYSANSANNISNKELLKTVNKLYDEILEKKNHYDEFTLLIEKLYHIRYSTIKCDILKSEARELYNKIMTNADYINNNSLFNETKKIVQFYEKISKMRNIKREFTETYAVLKDKIPPGKKYSERYNSIFSYLNYTDERNLTVDKEYYERINKYNEDIKIADRVYFMKMGFLRLLDSSSEMEERKEIENINIVDSNSIVMVNEIICRLNQKYNISYEDIHKSIQNIIKENVEYIELYNKYHSKVELSNVVEYIKYSDILPIIEKMNQFLIDDKNNNIKDYIEAYHTLRRIHFNYKDLHEELYNIIICKFENKNIEERSAYKNNINDKNITLGKYLEILSDIKRIEESLNHPQIPPPPTIQQQTQQLLQPHSELPILLNNHIHNPKLKNVIEYIESSENNSRRKIEMIRKYDNGNRNEKEVNEILKDDIYEIIKEITKLKPSSFSQLQKYLNNEDINENINNFNELIDIRKLCEREFSLNDSVTMIDEDIDGKIIEIVGKNKYKIKTIEGKTYIKSRESLMPIIIESIPFNEENGLKYEFEKELNILKEELQKLKEYGIDRMKTIKSVEEFSSKLDEKSNIEIQKKMELIRKLNLRYKKYIGILSFKLDLNKKRKENIFSSDERRKIDEFCDMDNEEIVENYDDDEDFKELYQEVKKIFRNHDI